MPYFVEYTNGEVKKFDGVVDPAALDDSVEAAYTVKDVYTKKAVFKSQSLTPKIVRRVRMADGTMKLREEMTAEEREWYLSQRRKKMQG